MLVLSEITSSLSWPPQDLPIKSHIQPTSWVHSEGKHQQILV